MSCVSGSVFHALDVLLIITPYNMLQYDLTLRFQMYCYLQHIAALGLGFVIICYMC